jgi:hypothetical protein
VGMAPIRRRMRIMRRTVPSVTEASLVKMIGC